MRALNPVSTATRAPSTLSAISSRRSSSNSSSRQLFGRPEIPGIWSDCASASRNEGLIREST